MTFLKTFYALCMSSRSSLQVLIDPSVYFRCLKCIYIYLKFTYLFPLEANEHARHHGFTKRKRSPKVPRDQRHNYRGLYVLYA